ncbi:Eukaryotic translation initiation factor 3 subunit H [Apiospora arundinis]
MLLVPSTTDFQDVPTITITQTSLGTNPKREEKGKGKEKEIPRKPVPKAAITSADTVEDDAEETGEPVDWAQYEPPEGLKDAHDVDSDIILNLLPESINIVKARIAAEAARKAEVEASGASENEENGQTAETEETKDAASEAAPQEPGTDGPQTDATTPAPEADHRQSGPASINFAGTRLTIDEHGMLRPAPLPPKSIKRSFLGLLRRLNIDKPESSSAGGSRIRGKAAATTADLDARLNALLAGKRYSSKSPKLNSPRDSAPASSSDSGSSTHNEQVECVSCLEDFDIYETVKTPCHRYCHDCFRRLIASACEHEQHWPPKCCLNIIPELFILAHSDEELKKQYHARAEEWSIPISERVYCHQPDCSALIRPAQVIRSLNIGRCAQGHETCIMCRGAQHSMTDNHGACPQDRDIQRTAELAEEAGWRKCIGCHAWVEHSDACQHMTCRCGAQFCYVCGNRWRTCSCDMSQLQQVKDAAKKRQEERELRQAQEDSEAAEAVRLVAEFELEEARKAALLRYEREQRAIELRRKELEERISREEARRATIEANFAKLRDILEDLHTQQRAAVLHELDRRAAALLHEAMVNKTTLAENNNVRREKTRAMAVAKLSTREKALEEELALRTREERRIEEAYRLALHTYYHSPKRIKIKGKGKEKEEVTEATDTIEGAVATELSAAQRADREVEKALKVFRRRNDSGFAAWRKFMDDEWETYQFQVLESRDIRLEAFDFAEARLDELAERDSAAFRTERRAQMEWVKVVIEERKRMLAELETAEVADGIEEIAELVAEQEAIAVADREDFTPAAPASPAAASSSTRPSTQHTQSPPIRPPPCPPRAVRKPMKRTLRSTSVAP